MNSLALEMEEFWEIFDKFSPQEMVINRIDQSVAYNVSALEAITLAILSDR